MHKLPYAIHAVALLSCPRACGLQGAQQYTVLQTPTPVDGSVIPTTHEPCTATHPERALAVHIGHHPGLAVLRQDVAFCWFLSTGKEVARVVEGLRPPMGLHIRETRAWDAPLRALHHYPGALQRGQWITYPHHMGHAAGAFQESPFERALVLVIDGAGEPAPGTTTLLWADSSARPRLRVLHRDPMNFGKLFNTVAAALNKHFTLSLAEPGMPWHPASSGLRCMHPPTWRRGCRTANQVSPPQTGVRVGMSFVTGLDLPMGTPEGRCPIGLHQPPGAPVPCPPPPLRLRLLPFGLLCREGDDFAGKFLAVQKSGEIFAPAKFWRCVTNNFIANSNAGCAAVYRAEGRDGDAFVWNVRWLCDWDALECRVAQDFESAHQEMTAGFNVQGGGEIIPFRNYGLRNRPLANLSPPPPTVLSGFPLLYGGRGGSLTAKGTTTHIAQCTGHTGAKRETDSAVLHSSECTPLYTVCCGACPQRLVSCSYRIL